MATETYVISASGKATIKKDPDDELDYTWDWTDWLDLVTDTIASHQILPADPSVTVTSSNLDGTSKMVTALLAGGTAGQTHQVTCRIVTVGGRTVDRSIYLKMRER